MKEPKPHPMGEPVPGRYFAFVEEIQTVTYHTLLVNAESEEEAQKIALEMHEDGVTKLRTFGRDKPIARIKPMREQHLRNE
jgi:hypothetical protein